MGESNDSSSRGPSSKSHYPQGNSLMPVFRSSSRHSEILIQIHLGRTTVYIFLLKQENENYLVNIFMHKLIINLMLHLGSRSKRFVKHAKCIENTLLVNWLQFSKGLSCFSKKNFLKVISNQHSFIFSQQRILLTYSYIQ